MQDNLRNTSRGSNIKPSISLEVKFKIVTPISSMIVFVNNKQQEAIRLAEIVAVLNKPKVEDGKEQLREPHNLLYPSLLCYWEWWQRGFYYYTCVCAEIIMIKEKDG